MTDEWDETVSALPGTLDEVLGPEKAFLVVVRGNNVGETFSVTGPDMVIGRAAGADLRLNDEGVSRFHCKLRQQPDGVYVEDLGSRNGTFLNGERVVPGTRALAEGDRLQVGTHSMLRFTYAESEDSPTPDPADTSAIRDALTDVFSRRHFVERLDAEVTAALARRSPLSLVLLHVDRFPEIAEQHGQPAGDAIAVAIANFLREKIRKDDVVGRLDAGDFALMSRWASPGDTFMLGERLRKSVPELHIPSIDGPLQLTLSVGVAAINELRIATAHDFLLAAGTALHRARSQGGNKIVLCTQDLLQEPKNPAKV